ncbi:MAG: DUF4405 domain-containing protein [Lachnospiraceae bacterium]|nr:DUF4405 domain-containing protein [Lachnospiraceae bacterium]
MKPKMKLKIAVDVAMTLLLILLMAYELVGEAAHEWLGMGICALFILHHVLNTGWSKNLLRGHYSVLRGVQTVLTAGVAITMVGSMISGLLLSEHTFSFFPIRSVYSYASRVHMLCAYWGFVLLSLHLGFHWNMMIGITKRYLRTNRIRTWVLRGAAFAIAAYGMYAFVERDIGNYMLLRYHFVFFDFEEPLFFCVLDYAAVMGLFVLIGHYLSTGIKKLLSVNKIA